MSEAYNFTKGWVMRESMNSIIFLCTLVTSTIASDDVKRINTAVTTPEHWSGLPIWGEQARELGYKLPLPFGVSLLYNDQSVPYASKNDFKIVAHGGLVGGGPGGSQNVSVPKEDVDITGRDQSIQLRVDAWIYPFLNVFGIVGYTNGNKDVVASTKNVEVPGKPLLENALRAIGSLPIPIEYEAYNVGLGAVIAGQVDPFDMHPIIMTLVGTYTVADTTTTDNNIYTTVGSFKVGQRYDFFGGKLAGLLGITYQHIDQPVTGSYDFSGTPLSSLFNSVDYDVHIVSDETLNTDVTLMYDFGADEEWSVMVSYGFLNWKQTTFSLGRRF